MQKKFLYYSSDEDYLIALDTTHWLPRVGELLSTATSISHSLVEGAHALVCFESGWDRTTQVHGVGVWPVRREGGVLKCRLVTWCVINGCMYIWN